jgi:hypothetical protein
VLTATTAPAATPVPTTTSTRAATVHTPRARIGGFDCVHLTVGITLDNSRSTAPATFRVFHSTRVNGTYQGYTDELLDVEAGKSVVQEMPLTDRAENDYRIEDIATHTVLADSGYQLCDARPHVTIGHPDRATLSVTVTLDHSRSPAATTFAVFGGSSSSTVVVGAGRTVVRTYPLRKDAVSQYSVSVEDLGIQATSAAVFCGNRPKVTLGAFDCSNLVALVTVDNSGTVGQFSYLVQYSYSYTDFTEDLTSLVEPGRVVVLKVPLGDNAYTSIHVGEEWPGGKGAIDIQRRGLCGLAPGMGRVSVSDVSCATGAFDVVVDNRQTPPRRAQNTVFLVASTRWPEDRHAFHQQLDVPKGAVGAARASMSALHGGRLRVTGYPNGYTPPSTVIFLGTPHRHCPAPGPGAHVPSARSASAAVPTTAELARTGGPDLGLVPLGLLMVVTAAGATWLSRRFAD